MLVISRKPNERVQVGELGWVHVCAVRGDRVRLGFNFPARVKITRSELLEQQAAIEAAIPEMTPAT